MTLLLDDGQRHLKPFDLKSGAIIRGKDHMGILSSLGKSG